MKLSDHVDKIRNLITASFDKQFARLGIGANKQIELEKLPEQVRGKRQHLEVMLENHIGETGCYQDAREKLLDELSFTLFNRLAAVKVMESANLFPPVITKQAEHGGRSFGHKAWLEEYPENRDNELEGIRDYFKYAFNELGDSLPLYSKEYPYALLPDAISLNEIIEAFNAIEEDSQVEDDIWQSDDVLGWLYESYNNAKKQAFKDSKAKTEYDKVSLQSQVYTPRWVVQFLVENSLGKLYLEMYPESEIKDQFKIANAPKTQERDPKPLHEIKLIDPASGSGNFLLYAFDFFYALYIDQIENYDADYDEDEIPQLIIENNLHGIDLDDRAIQLAQLGLYIKARKKRRFIKGSFNFKVVSSDFYLPDYDKARHIFEDGDNLDNTQKELIEDIWNDLRYAYKFGSLIRLDEKLKAKLNELEAKHGDKVLDLFADADIREQKDFTEKFFNNLKNAVEQFSSKDADTFIASKTRDAITFLELLTTEYDVACANPPYTDSGDFGSELKTFVEANYKKPNKFHSNLYSSFIMRCYELIGQSGMVAMIHPDTFMFIKSFEDVRNFLINEMHLNTLVHFGTGGVFGTKLRVIYPVLYVLQKQKNNTPSIIIDLRKVKMDAEVERKALNECLNSETFIRIDQDNFKKIETSPFVYWISDGLRDKFKKSTIQKHFKNCQGLATADNDRFLRYWWEVKASNIYTLNKDASKKWFMYAKGGPNNKWYGNNWLIVNWEEDGKEIRGMVDKNGKQRSRPQNESFYFKEGITYSATGGDFASYRILPEDFIFDIKGSSIFPLRNTAPNSYLLAVLNSKFSNYIVGCLNPTVEIQVGDIKRIPLIIPKKSVSSKIASLVEMNIKIRKQFCQHSILEHEYLSSPLESYSDSNLNFRISRYLNEENFLNCIISLNETYINYLIEDIYELSDGDKNALKEKEGTDCCNYPVDTDALDAFILKYRKSDFYDEEILHYISNQVKAGFKESEMEADGLELKTLYQKNNDFLAFSGKKQINPINLWFIFSKLGQLPKQRKNRIALEFLLQLINEILLDDEDGIVPLIPNAGEKRLVERVENKFIEKGFTQAQFSTFDTILGITVTDFIDKYFFSEISNLLNLFLYLPKTPYIWHLTSGPMQGFDCYISIYKWSRDNLLRVRSIYIEHRERALINRQSDLANNESVDAQNEKDKIFKQLKEIEIFKAKIDELLEEGYDPILDDGVAKNIAPLQNKKMLAYDVLNAKQMKKYLNADW
ncbi:BREX-1 system adenine-specific DNA-methyltransferase PglX [Aliiglaciecola sp. SL4]|uniref:BREX-1 system adenine-specific DNA-methyltransferase PglX n=1 Tax=Aliiglaciecola sp. SL4 TaxID=3239806 RepID=UPI00355AE85B